MIMLEIVVNLTVKTRLLKIEIHEIKILLLPFFFLQRSLSLNRLYLLGQTPKPACGVWKLCGGWAAIQALPSLPFCSWPPCWPWPSLSFTSPGRGRWKILSIWLPVPGITKANHSLLLTYHLKNLSSVFKKHVFKLKLVDKTQLCYNPIIPFSLCRKFYIYIVGYWPR